MYSHYQMANNTFFSLFVTFLYRQCRALVSIRERQIVVKKNYGDVPNIFYYVKWILLTIYIIAWLTNCLLWLHHHANNSNRIHESKLHIPGTNWVVGGFFECVYLKDNFIFNSIFYLESIQWKGTLEIYIEKRKDRQHGVLEYAHTKIILWSWFLCQTSSTILKLAKFQIRMS